MNEATFQALLQFLDRVPLTGRGEAFAMVQVCSELDAMRASSASRTDKEKDPQA
jgi:hypothetical protein